MRRVRVFAPRSAKSLSTFRAGTGRRALASQDNQASQDACGRCATRSPAVARRRCGRRPEDFAAPASVATHYSRTPRPVCGRHERSSGGPDVAGRDPLRGPASLRTLPGTLPFRGPARPADPRAWALPSFPARRLDRLRGRRSSDRSNSRRPPRNPLRCADLVAPSIPLPSYGTGLVFVERIHCGFFASFRHGRPPPAPRPEPRVLRTFDIARRRTSSCSPSRQNSNIVLSEIRDSHLRRNIMQH